MVCCLVACGVRQLPADVAGEQVSAVGGRRRCAPELLQGEPWLRFLDGPQSRSFSAGAGRVLLDGGFRPQLEADQFDAVRVLARARFLELMEGRR